MRRRDTWRHLRAIRERGRQQPVRPGAGANRTGRDGGSAHGEATPRMAVPISPAQRSAADSLRPGPCEAVATTCRWGRPGLASATRWGDVCRDPNASGSGVEAPPCRQEYGQRWISPAVASLQLIKPKVASVVEGLTATAGMSGRNVSSPVRHTFFTLYVHHRVWSCNVDVRRGSYAARTIGGHTRDAMRRRRKQAG